MPTVNINAGLPIRLNSGGTILIYNTAASQDYAVLHVVAGSARCTLRPKERIPISSFGSFTGKIIPGDQQLNELEFEALVTKLGATAATNLHTLLHPAETGGELPTFKVEIKIPDGNGGTTGTLIPFPKCFLSDDGEDFSFVEGKAVDKVKMKFIDVSGPIAVATYS